MATAAATAAAVATTAGMVAVGGVGEGRACVQSRAANVGWLSLRCKIEWFVRHGPKHLLCPVAPHVLGSAGLNVSGIQRDVDHKYISAEFHVEEGKRNPRAAIAVGVCYMGQS